jgi:hypothetical protein
MDSNNSASQELQKASSKSPQKRIYLRQGILESRKDFAERFVRRMREEGMIPPQNETE